MSSSCFLSLLRRFKLLDYVTGSVLPSSSERPTSHWWLGASKLCGLTPIMWGSSSKSGSLSLPLSSLWSNSSCFSTYWACGERKDSSGPLWAPMGDNANGFLSVDSRYAGFLRKDCTSALGSFDSSSAGFYPITIAPARGTLSVSLSMYWRNSSCSFYVLP